MTFVPSASRQNRAGLTCLIAACLMMFISHSSAEEPSAYEWKLVKDKKEIQVFTRKIKDSKYREIKAVTIIKSSYTSVMGLLNDIDACEHWIHLCDKGITLAEINDAEHYGRYVYQITDLPFPASNRDAVFKTSVVWSKDNQSVIITLENEPDYIAETKNIRIRHSYGRYVVESLGDGTARLTWIQFVDPAGSLPAFLVNAIAVNFPYKSLLNFKKWVTRPEYQLLEFEYDKMGDIVGFKNVDNQQLDIKANNKLNNK